MRPEWAARLGEDHLLKLDALGAISDTALTRETTIEMAASGLPTTFVPGRNLAFLTFAGALAYRRGTKHLVAGMCETHAVTRAHHLTRPAVMLREVPVDPPARVLRCTTCDAAYAAVHHAAPVGCPVSTTTS